jgi:hypothetical protein
MTARGLTRGVMVTGRPWRVPVVAPGVEEGDDHGHDPFGAAGHVHVRRAREGELAVWQQLGSLDGVGLPTRN